MILHAPYHRRGRDEREREGMKVGRSEVKSAACGVTSNATTLCYTIFEGTELRQTQTANCSTISFNVRGCRAFRNAKR